MDEKTITVKGTPIAIFYQNEEDYVSLTDIAKGFVDDAEERNSDYFILNWLRLGNTVEFLGAWEMVHNANFNPVGYDRIKLNLTSNTFRLSVKRWLEETGAIGLVAKAGRYGGTFAHKDIALQFRTNTSENKTWGAVRTPTTKCYFWTWGPSS